MAIIGWTRRHQLLAYLLLTFVLSWSAILAVVLPTVGFPAPPEAFSTEGAVFGACIFGTLLGPAIASVVLTGVLGGKPAFRELRSRLGRTRVSAGYYAIALAPPALLLGVLAVLMIFDASYRPGFITASASAVAVGLLYAVAAGFLEELGWTGFATPRLLTRFGALRGALILGAIWTLWHVLPVYTFTAAIYGNLYFFNLLQSLVFLTSFRVVMVMVYERTGSLFVGQVLHFSLTAASILVVPVTGPGKIMVWNSLWPLTLMALAIVITRLWSGGFDGRLFRRRLVG